MGGENKNKIAQNLIFLFFHYGPILGWRARIPKIKKITGLRYANVRIIVCVYLLLYNKQNYRSWSTQNYRSWSTVIRDVKCEIYYVYTYCICQYMIVFWWLFALLYDTLLFAMGFYDVTEQFDGKTLKHEQWWCYVPHTETLHQKWKDKGKHEPLTIYGEHTRLTLKTLQSRMQCIHLFVYTHCNTINMLTWNIARPC